MTTDWPLSDHRLTTALYIPGERHNVVVFLLTQDAGQLGATSSTLGDGGRVEELLLRDNLVAAFLVAWPPLLASCSKGYIILTSFTTRWHEFEVWVEGLRPVGIYGHLQGENMPSYNLFSPAMMSTWRMKLGRYLPLGYDALLPSISASSTSTSTCIKQDPDLLRYEPIPQKTCWPLTSHPDLLRYEPMPQKTCWPLTSHPDLLRYEPIPQKTCWPLNVPPRSP